MTEDRIIGMPPPEDWGAYGDARDYPINPGMSTALLMDQMRSMSSIPFPMDNSGNGVMCSCGEMYEPNMGNYYIDEIDNTNQSEDPQFQWRLEQEDMIKEYLTMAYKDLMQKKEMCLVKQERLRLARDELNIKLDALNRIRNGANDLSSILALSNGYPPQGAEGGVGSMGHSPEELMAEVEMVKQRIKKLVTELVRMRSSITMSEKGIDALTIVNKMISERGRMEMPLDEVGEMMRGIHGMNASIKASEQRKKELIKSVADLGQHFFATNPNVQPTLNHDLAFACSDTASQTELSGDLSKRYGTIAKLKLNHTQNKRCIVEVLEQIIEVENQLIPCAIQFDANRLLLIEEKNKLLEELRRQQSPDDSDDKIRDLEEDLVKVKEIFKRDIQLDNQRLNLTKRKMELEEELLQRARIGANLEMQIKSLHLSMNSISSGSSLGSLGSLSASSRGSQSSVALHDVYSMQELNRSLHQVNLPELHHRMETLIQDQIPPPSRSSSTLSGRHPLGGASFSSSSTYPLNVMPDDISDMRGLPSFHQYPTVQEETEDGDEGFGGYVEDEDNERSVACVDYLDQDVSKPPPSYEDHFQISVLKNQQPQGTCLYQRASQPPQLNASCPERLSENFYGHQSSYPLGNSYCLYQQPEFALRSSMIQQQNPRKLSLAHQQQHDLYQELYRQQLNTSSAKNSNQFQTPPKLDYSSDPLNNNNNNDGFSSGCHKACNNVPYPNNLLSSNSLPSLLNASAMNPMTFSGSESQIFRQGAMECSPHGYPFICPIINAGVGMPDSANRYLKTDKLPTVSRSLLREFGVENNNNNNNKMSQQLDDQIIRNNILLQQQHLGNFCLRQPHRNVEFSSSVSIPTYNNNNNATTHLDAFSPKSSSTSHLHNLNEGMLTANCCNFANNPNNPFHNNKNNNNGNNNNNNLSSLSLSTSSLAEDGSLLGSDSGVFESANRLNNVLSAQIHVQVMYDYARQEILVCIERARNLSALSIHSFNEVVFKVFILPSTNGGDSYVEDTNPASPLHSLPSYSNLGKVFHFPVESEKVLSKTIQVFVLRLKDFNAAQQQQQQRSHSRVESVGMSLISLASFDLNSCLSSWYNILSLQYMEVDTNKYLPTPVPSMSPEMESNMPSVISGHANGKKVVEFKNLPVSSLKEDSSDGSTVTSQNSTLTRADEFEDNCARSRAKVVTSSQNQENKQSNDSADRKKKASILCDKETNTDIHKVLPCNPSTPFLMRKPIAPGSKFNREIAIRRWQTFSPAAVPSEEDEHNHKLNRSGSDSSVRRKNSHFNRQAAHRQSIRLKLPSLGAKRHAGPMDLPKNHTSIDVMLDYQAYKTKLENLNKEIVVLQTIKNKLEEAKSAGETEPSWLMENEELQALLLETSGTFREKACDRRKLSDITDLADRKIRKVKMEMLSLKARKSIVDIDRMVFKKKMSFFTSPDENLTFLDHLETEVDDRVEENPAVESRTESRTVPLSIKPSHSSGDKNVEDFENMLF